MYKNNYILDNYFFKKKKITIKDLSSDLTDDFNYQNILVCYIISKIYNIPNKIFQKTIKNFEGLQYRSIKILNNNNFIVINNSKATNVEAAYNSIRNYKNILLIVGGLSKEKNFKKITKLFKNVSKAYVYGESSDLIFSQLKSKIKVEKFKNLEEIVKNIFKNNKFSKRKKTILFAPACKSFDQYNNFEERGNHFNKLIRKFCKI